ncbi:MAG: hypothetical protein NVSMB32_03020 [Actinomycetota bacterium]
MYVSGLDEAAFIRDHLGPDLRAAGLATTVLGVDNNWSEMEYAATLLSDAGAARYISATAWHCYQGTPEAMGRVHDLDPSKPVLESECSGGSWQVGDLLQGITRQGIMAPLRNWSGSVVLWNIALDANGGPTNGGCPACRGVVTIDQASGQIIYNPDYYALGHVAKFVEPGAFRVDSSEGAGDLASVAFVNPSGARVLVVSNPASTAQTFTVRERGRTFTYRLPASAVGTFSWPTQAAR